MLDAAVAAAAAADDRWRSTVARCVAVATDSFVPGPVHINAAFDEPLVEDSITKELPAELAGRPGGRPWTADARLVAGMSIQVDEALALLDRLSEDKNE